MNKIENSVRGYEILPVEDLLYSRNRTCFFTGPVTPESCEKLLKELMLLESENQEEIRIIINSPGGEVTSGLGLLGYLSQIQSPLRCTCIGEAASMGSLIFLAAQTREMMPFSKIMIHGCSFNKFDVGHMKAEEISKKVLELEAINRTIASIIHQRTGIDIDKVNSWLKEDTFFNCEEAFNNNIATDIFEENFRGYPLFKNTNTKGE